MFRLLLVSFLVFLLAGCGPLIKREIRYQEGLDSPPSGVFERGVYDGHIDLAWTEVNEDDFGGACLFLDRARASYAGDIPLPDSLEERDMSPENFEVASAKRRQLLQVLGRGARESHPEAAAEAQIKYDCWIEELEEDRQPAHIAACYGGLESALSKLQGLLGISSDSVDAYEIGDVLVYFAFDSANITRDSDKDIVSAARDAVLHETILVVVTAHADRRGTAKYNYELSVKRAQAVRDVLVANGIPDDIVLMIARGEDALPIQTEDEVIEPLNRRARIEFRF